MILPGNPTGVTQHFLAFDPYLPDKIRQGGTEDLGCWSSGVLEYRRDGASADGVRVTHWGADGRVRPL